MSTIKKLVASCNVSDTQRFVAFLIWKRYFWSERKNNDEKDIEGICLHLLHDALEKNLKEINANFKAIPGTLIYEKSDDIQLYFDDFESKVVWEHALKHINKYVPEVSNAVKQIGIDDFNRLKANIEQVIQKVQYSGVYATEDANRSFTGLYRRLVELSYVASSIKIWYKDPEMLAFETKSDKFPKMWIPTDFLKEVAMFERTTGIVLHNCNDAVRDNIEDLEKRSMMISAYYLINSLENHYDEDAKKHVIEEDEPESDKYPIDICKYAIMFSKHSNDGKSAYINKYALNHVVKCTSMIADMPNYDKVLKIVEDTTSYMLAENTKKAVQHVKSTRIDEVKDFIDGMPETFDLYKLFCIVSRSTTKEQAFKLIIAFNEIFEAINGLCLHDAETILDLPIREFAESEWVPYFEQLFKDMECKTLFDVYNTLVVVYEDTASTYDTLKHDLSVDGIRNDYAPVANIEKFGKEFHDKLTILSKLTGLGKSFLENKENEAPEEDDHFSPDDDSCGHHCHTCAARKNCPEWKECNKYVVRNICPTYLKNNIKPVRHVRRIVIIKK